MKRVLASISFMVAAQLTAFAANAVSYNPVGPQTNVPLSTVTGGGWTMCFSETYDTTGTSIASVLSQCPGAQLMLACRLTGSNTIQLLAEAPKADVLTANGQGNIPHNANGTGWYFNSDWSWGFAAQGDTISRDECDVDTSGANNQRLCWHTLGGNGSLSGGFRCGADEDLNSSAAFERLIFQTVTAGSIPTLTEWMLVLLGAILFASGVIFMRRRRR